MKTYTIKPLEWENSRDRLFCGKYIIQHGVAFYELQYKEKGAVHFHDLPTISACKAKAQELHEQELLKYLEPTE